MITKQHAGLVRAIHTAPPRSVNTGFSFRKCLWCSISQMATHPRSRPMGTESCRLRTPAA
eukprot:8499697-Heterocapsa_arctica.AAC.1